MKNGCNFGTINARCLFLVLKESSDDFKQHLFQAFSSIGYIGPETVFHFQYALTAAIWGNGCRGCHDGPITELVHNTLVYLCVKFGALMIKYTKVMIFFSLSAPQQCIKFGFNCFSRLINNSDKNSIFRP